MRAVEHTDVRLVLATAVWISLLLLPVGVSRAVAAEVGQSAPPFTLPSLFPDGAPVDLAEYRGRVVYLDFWSSWCAPCRRTLPQLSALRDEFHRDAFEVIGISVDQTPADALQFLERTPVDYPVAQDAATRTALRYRVDHLPWALLIDAEGIVREVFRGRSAEDLAPVRARVQELVGGFESGR